MLKPEVIVGLVMLGLVFQDPAKPMPGQKPTTQKQKLAPFPKDKAKWMIHGKVKAEALLAQRFLYPRIPTPGKKGAVVELQLRPRQNPRNLMLPGAMVTVVDPERKWKSSATPQTRRIKITRQRRFEPRTVILHLRDSAICENQTGSPLLLGLFAYGPHKGGGQAWRIAHAKKLLIERNLKGGKAFLARTLKEGIGGACNLTNLPLGTYFMLGSTDCPDSQCWVYLSAHPICTVTDENGRFSLPKLPDGEYKLVVTHDLLGKITQTVKIAGRPRKWVMFEFKVPEKLRAKPIKQPKKRK